MAGVTTRVVQWTTGNTGRLALRALIDAPDLELVGVRVYDPQKTGRDAGELVERPPTGVLTTDSKDEVLALAADVVLYMARIEQNSETCLADITDLLASGADVVTTGSSLIDRRTAGDACWRAIEAACMAGSSTFLGVGLFPGFWGEAVAPVLSRRALSPQPASQRSYG